MVNPNGKSAAVLIRDRLIGGEAVPMDDLLAAGYSRSTVHTAVSKLRSQGLVVCYDDGAYSLEPVPAAEVAARRRRAPAEREPAVDYPPLGATVIRLEQVGRRVIVTVSDGTREWAGPMSAATVERQPAG